ncbi:MAG: DNA translocase FtsK [Verrucomicrobiota bacterium]|nr:DNA translocase FtsK [Verrucomicrobiota bacterium]
MPSKASKAATGVKPRMDLGWIGILMFAVAFLYILSLLSYDPSDPPLNRGDTTEGYQNMIGPVGAYLSYISFMAIGFAAYMMPLLLMIFGAAFIHPFFIHLRQSWKEPVAAVVYLLGLMGLLQELDTNFGLAFWAPGFQLGGVLGEGIIYPLFHFFGTAGAVIIHSALILASLYYLTNLQPVELWHWAVDTWEEWRERRAQPGIAAVGPIQKTVQRKTKRLKRDLDKRKKAVEQELEQVTEELEADKGLGADLKPVPKPTIRDLSVLDEEQRTKAKAEQEPDEVEMGEVISAEEVKASTDTKDDKAGNETKTEKRAERNEHKVATTEDILGQADEAKDESKEKPNETTEDETKPDEPEPKTTPKPKLPRHLAKPKGPASVAKTPKVKGYKLPKSMLLDEPEPLTAPTETREQLLANARLLKDTLQQFRIEVTEGDITKGPTITRYELHPAPGVKLERISGLANNISAAIKAERINILAPVPGRSSVGIEVPNRIKTKVLFRDIIDSPEWKKSKAKIPLALGKDVYGKPIVADLADMPHMLIAGATGSGKSVCINSIVASLLFRFSPEELRFVMIDPKVVELQIYNGLPHLAAPVVHDPKKVILALKWVVNEMEKRYQIFAKVGARNIDGFNSRSRKKPEKTDQSELPLDEGEGFAVEMDQEVTVEREDEIEIPDKLSYIVVIIDELADLMLMARNDVENSIARITQMARAAGIHCIVATQRPSVDVITGVIKANIPARIAFQVAAKVDSRTILDAMGADKLLGKGDMLFLPPGTSNLSRAQGCLVTDEEINRIVEIVNNQAKPSYDKEMERQLEGPLNDKGGNGSSGIDEDEEIVQQCIEVIRVEQKASVSLMQRRLRLGYTRAARIMDELEDRGLVGPSRGAEPREILFDVGD